MSRVTGYAHGRPSPYAIATTHATVADFQGPGANEALYFRIMDSASGSITAVKAYCSNSAGNVSVAVCSGPSGRNHPNLRKGTTGTIACPAGSSNVSMALTGATQVDPGDWLAISSSAGTATFACNSPNQTTSTSSDSPGIGLFALEASAHPVPATPAPGSSGWKYLILLEGA